MKFNDFQKLLEKPIQCTGYMVDWELRENGSLTSQHSPDKHAGEPLIDSHQEALELAKKLALVDADRYVNIYVVDGSFKRCSEIFNKYPVRKTV